MRVQGGDIRQRSEEQGRKGHDQEQRQQEHGGVGRVDEEDLRERHGDDAAQHHQPRQKPLRITPPPVQGLTLQQGFGFRVSGFVFRVCGFGFRVYVFGFIV